MNIAIDEFQAGFRKVQLIAADLVAAIAVVILMGMVGRIIADSRKETAVFRALGVSRFSIAQVYLTYTVYLAAHNYCGACLRIWVSAVGG